MKTHYKIGDYAYAIYMPTQKTVHCEAWETDDLYDENGECTRDCFKDCIKPQAAIEKVQITTKSIMDITAEKEEDMEYKPTVIYNDEYTHESEQGQFGEPDIRQLLFDTEEEARKALDECEYSADEAL